MRLRTAAASTRSIKRLHAERQRSRSLRRRTAWRTPSVHLAFVRRRVIQADLSRTPHARSRRPAPTAPAEGREQEPNHRQGGESAAFHLHSSCAEFYSPHPPSPKPCGLIASARRQDATSTQPCGGFHASNQIANATCRVSAHGNGRPNSRCLSDQHAAHQQPTCALARGFAKTPSLDACCAAHGNPPKPMNWRHSRPSSHLWTPSLPGCTSHGALVVLARRRAHAAAFIPFRLLRLGRGTRCPGHRTSS